MPTLQSKVASSRLAVSLATQIEVLREEQARTAEIEMRAEDARKVLAECDREHDASVRRQAVLTQAISFFEDLIRLSEEKPLRKIGLDVEVEEHVEARTKPVARLGKQHYRMLYALRGKRSMSVPDLAIASYVQPRRVKGQMIEDAERGIVRFDENSCELTLEGEDLLQRFEDYRHSIGKPLPSLEASPSEDESDEEVANVSAREEERV